MKLTVDGASCMGHGRCYQMAPELLSCDDEGFVTIRGQTIDVPGDSGRGGRGRRRDVPGAGDHG